MENIIKKKILNKQAVVGVIGLGYVGLPLAMLISNKGFKTYGFDIDENKIKLLKKKKSYITHIPEEKIKEAKNLIPTNDFSLLKKCDVVIICVPTPTTDTNEPDLSPVINTAETIAKYLRKGQLVVLESTTYPTTTRDVLKPILEKTGLKCGVDFYLAFSPEREDPGRKDFNTETIPKVVGGVDKVSGEIATLFYSQVVKKVVPVSSSEVAEATKMLENTFRAVNIALVNELKMLFDRMGIDIWEVIEASKTKPFGFMPFYPGPGWGGHCFEKNQKVLVKTLQGLKLFSFEQLFEYVKNKMNKLATCRIICGGVMSNSFSNNVTEVLKLNNELQVVGLNLYDNSLCLQSINFISKRLANDLFRLNASFGFELTLTSKHPIFVFDKDKNKICIKFVEEVEPEIDYFILPKNLPSVYSKLEFDLIDMLVRYYPSLIKNYRVRLKYKTWKLYKDIVYKEISDERKYDWLKNDYLPLEKFLKIENKLNLKRDDLILCSGRGNSKNEFLAKVVIDKNFARLIGYYLAEGCITEDKKSMRLRFTFNVKEKEYIEDLKSILDSLNIRYSIYKDKNFNSITLKISNKLLCLFFKDVLKTGVNSYEMKIPEYLYFSNKEIRKEVLKGLFRGDAGVYLHEGKRSYFKNSKFYNHNNSLELCYYTSCEILFHQVVSILLENNVLPIVDKRRKGLIKIFGSKKISNIEDLFLGEKDKKLKLYFLNVKKQPDYKNYFEDDKFFYLKIKEIKPLEDTQEVYSLEVEPYNNLVVNYNILVHNCIPVDPFYLSYIAKKYDFTTHFIELAGQVNIRMPEFVVEKVVDELNKRKKSIYGAKVLVLGLSYKKDIGDPRESPSFKIIELLEKKGAKVDYNDPYIPETPKMRKFKFYKKSVSLDKNVIKKYDCVIITTEHSCYDYKMIVDNAKLIFDTRDAVFNNLKKNFKNVVKA